MQNLTSDLVAKPKRSKGRPKKNFDPSKTYSWFDESEYQRALKDYKRWEDAFAECKNLTGSEFETLEEYENELRLRHPSLEKLDIKQLYILEGNQREDFELAFTTLKGVNKPTVNKETYTVKIPSKNALEYSQYLAIVQAFTELRKENNKINIMMLPQITNNNIVFDIRSGQLRVNAYKFTEDYR